MKYNDIADITRLLSQIGWAERNAGNFSMQITQELCSILRRDFQQVNELSDFENELKDLVSPDSSLIELNLFISISGCRFREIYKNPSQYTGILSINFIKKNILWYHMEKDAMPSSEWRSHLRLHLEMIRLNSRNLCILHTHPTELIALSHKLAHLNEDEINNILWNMMPEVKYFIPKGIGLVPLQVPGSDELAKASKEKIRFYDIILWQKHGCLAMGKDLWDSFESIEIINKAAKIYLLAH
ncbi:MAG TPA: rhamnulose-1-phosphate aldolase [Candidatus Cloacimonadota bacterium]|nr:rhamnulose-1-phosphate aldolase [Candidatus Cloacimonadota bacterium]